MNALIEEIRNGTLALRMVPVGERSAASAGSCAIPPPVWAKEVNFEIVGGDAELDKSMVERLPIRSCTWCATRLTMVWSRPRTHCCGQVTCRQAGVECAARNRCHPFASKTTDAESAERVLQRAWNKGLRRSGVVPSDDAINMLILSRGFHRRTGDQSLGRGVGMDVVKRNIESLRGTIKLVSNPGQGLVVRYPTAAHLAIIDGFMVGISQSNFVLPLETVVEAKAARPRDVKVDAGGRHCLVLRGPCCRWCGCARSTPWNRQPQ